MVEGPNIYCYSIQQVLETDPMSNSKPITVTGEEIHGNIFAIVNKLYEITIFAIMISSI